MYKIDYFKSGQGIKKVIVDFDNIIHNTQKVFVKEKMKECKECPYNLICVKINAKNTDAEDELVAKQFLNEAILDCHYYHKINSNLDVHILKHQRMFSVLLEEEIQKRKNAEQGVGLN